MKAGWAKGVSWKVGDVRVIVLHSLLALMILGLSSEQ